MRIQVTYFPSLYINTNSMFFFKDQANIFSKSHFAHKIAGKLSEQTMII